MRRQKTRIQQRERPAASTAKHSPISWNSSDSFKLLIIAALAAIPYVPSLDGDFVFDDAATIINNPIVTGKYPLKQIFTSDYWGFPIASAQSHKSYRPLTTLTFWVNYHLHGEYTKPYHLLNIMLHVLSSLLVYALIRQLQSSVMDSFTWNEASLAAALFATHPVHSEAVANISGRAELLMAVFALAALCMYQRCIRSDRFDIYSAAAVYVLVVLSVFSKEQGIVVLPICLFLELLHCYNSTHYKYIVLRSLLLIAYALTLIFLRLYINNFTAPKFSELDNPAAFVEDPVLRIASYSYLWLFQLRLLVLPYSLCFDYSMGCIPPITEYGDFRILSLLVISLLMLCALCIIVKSNNRLLTFSIAFGLLSFLPASNLLVTVGFTVAERVLYLPSVGLCVIAGVMHTKLVKYFFSIDKLVLAIIAVAMTMTYQRSEEWRTELNLYASGLRVCRQNAKIHYNLGKVLSKNGDLEAAELCYQNAIRLNPNYEHAMNNLANILESKGRRLAAELLLRKAIQKKPTFATAWMNLGITLMNQGKYNQSLHAYRQSLRIRPNSADCQFNLGNLFRKMGDPYSAMDAWRSAVRLESGHSRALTNLFVVLRELDRCGEVMKAVESVSHSTVYTTASLAFQIGVCLGGCGRFAEAEKYMRTAVQLKPHNAMYHANLGVLYQRWARYKLAENSYLTALALEDRGDRGSILSNLKLTQEKLNSTKVEVRLKSVAFSSSLGAYKRC